MKILLDTCGLIYWTLDPEQLSAKTLKAISANNVFVSSISIWEVGLKIKNKKIDIGMPIEEYSLNLKELGNLTIVPINENIWIKNLALKWAHRDPADRTIVATAMPNKCHIVTTDKRIKKFYSKVMN